MFLSRSDRRITYPSTIRPAPVMKLLIGEARKTIESAISSISPSRLIGTFSISFSMTPAAAAAFNSGVPMYPGQMALIRTPSAAN